MVWLVLGILVAILGIRWVVRFSRRPSNRERTRLQTQANLARKVRAEARRDRD